MNGAEIKDEVISKLLNGVHIETVEMTDSKSFNQSNFRHSANNYYVNSDDITRMISPINISCDLDITWENRIQKSVLPSYYYTNYQKLETLFTKEIEKRSKVEADIENSFSQLASIISELPFSDSFVELTSEFTLKFILSFPNNKLLMISQIHNNTLSPFDNGEIVFSLFINRELIASNATEISSFVEGFKKYLSL